jgi:hypothetical protein
MQKSVGSHQVDLGLLRPAREEPAQDPRGRTLANADASGQADHVRHFCGRVAEKRGPRAIENALGLDIQAQQTGQRQVDLDHLVYRDWLVQALKTQHVFGRQGQGGTGAQPGPLGSRELRVRRPGGHVRCPAKNVRGR